MSLACTKVKKYSHEERDILHYRYWVFGSELIFVMFPVTEGQSINTNVDSISEDATMYFIFLGVLAM